MLKLLLRDSLIYTIPAILSRGLSLLLLPLYTRVLNPADYASLDLLLVFANFISLSIALEISQAVARFYGSETDPKRKIDYASTAFWFTISSYSIFSITAFFHSEMLSAWVMGRPEFIEEFRAGIIYVFFNGILILSQDQFRWEMRSKHYAAVSILVTISSAAIAICLTYIYHLGLKGLLWGMAVGAALGQLYCLWFLRKTYQFRFNPSRFKEMLAYSAPLVPASLMILLGIYIDRLMINYFMPIENVGLYGIGFRFASAISLVMFGFQGALTPLIYTYYQDNETPKKIARIFRTVVALALIATLVTSLFAYDFFVLMTSPEYYSASDLITLLVPAIILAQIIIFTPGINIAKKTHLSVWINLAGLLIKILLGSLLIPAIGVKGAALATLLGCLFSFSINMYFSQKFYPVPHDWRKIILACIVFAVFIILSAEGTATLPTGQRLLASIFLICVSPIIITFFGLINLSELREIISIASNRIKKIHQRAH